MKCFPKMTDAGRHVPQDMASADWESPAGCGSGGAPRPLRGEYVYRGGGGDVHWLGQPCDVLISPLSRTREKVLVVFACGCHGSVPRSTLTKLPGFA